MEKNMIENSAPTSSVPVDAGRWVAVDQNNLGFSVPALPNGQPVQGPDGALYCTRKSQDVVAPVAGNANNAIPTPSGIVQLPPIVQPIALVPYTSQNQPLLQYDPYSRPVDQTAEQKAPTYVRKPYKGISIAGLIVALLGLFGFLFLVTFTLGVAGKMFGNSEAGPYSGYDIIAGIVKVFDIKDVFVWYSNLYLNLSGSPRAMLALAILPFISLIIAVLYVCLAIKYIAKLATGKSPRSVSVLAIINTILTIFVIILGGFIFNAEVAAEGILKLEFDSASIVDYLMNTTTTITETGFYVGAGVWVSLVASIALIILPLCPKKNAYMVEQDPSKESYSIN